MKNQEREAKLIAAADKFLADLKVKKDAENVATERAIKIVKRALKGANFEAVFAGVAKDISCPNLHLGWTLDRFWAQQIEDLVMPQLERIYAELEKRNADKKNKINFNDADDDVFFLPHQNHKVVCHTSQNFNFIFVWEKEHVSASGMFQTLHIRRYYDRIEDYVGDDEWNLKEVEEFKAAVTKNGYKQAVVKAHWFGDFADDYPDNPYPNRYSLQHYIDGGFEMKYRDARDKGYVATWEKFQKKVDYSPHSHTELGLIVECFVPCMLGGIFEENGDG